MCGGERRRPGSPKRRIPHSTPLFSPLPSLERFRREGCITSSSKSQTSKPTGKSWPIPAAPIWATGAHLTIWHQLASHTVCVRRERQRKDTDTPAGSDSPRVGGGRATHAAAAAAADEASPLFRFSRAHRRPHSSVPVKISFPSKSIGQSLLDSDRYLCFVFLLSKLSSQNYPLKILLSHPSPPNLVALGPCRKLRGRT